MDKQNNQSVHGQNNRKADSLRTDDKNRINENKDKRVEINDGVFPEKGNGMTLVDAYYIPDEYLPMYLEDRQVYTEKAYRLFEEWSDSVSIDYKGSQDGEALVGRDAQGEILYFIHLDPEGIAGMKEADQSGQLEDYLKNR